ncbi:hypothetical protein LVD15_19170 [Fulvivirga maritima]|uniref:hypothetical protein n=1 Tax=Fulvivirga maritima TaxID=2904247 RepID=UPI001F21EF7A|nr:hypothetical protein [Fulvivirga maritima]UII25408.1 hypothetical protein LVD15_19170 [Fulvivirga maritima]
MSEFNKLSKFIYDHYGINLPVAKKVLLESRLQKHLRKIGIPTFKKYIERVCNDKEHEEVVYMINLVSTNKTDFFREKSHFDYMRSIILPKSVADGERDVKISERGQLQRRRSLHPRYDHGGVQFTIR